jgi:hypothetical protein
LTVSKLGKAKAFAAKIIATNAPMRRARLAGGSPAAGPFLLLAQKKGAKEKGTPLCRPFGASLVRLPELGGSQTRTIRFAATCSDTLASTAPNSAIRPTRHRGDINTNTSPGLRTPRRSAFQGAISLLISACRPLLLMA